MFFRAILIFLLFFGALFGKEYSSIDKSEWEFGAVKIDINFNNGAFDSIFGVFVDEDTIITSSEILDLGFPVDINLKMQDEQSKLIICVAKANLVANDFSLAMLKIAHFTDDYCNFSDKKLYHDEIIRNQQIFKIQSKLNKNSPFLIDNKAKTISIESGFPYFDKSGAFVGISSESRVISKDSILKFYARYK